MSDGRADDRITSDPVNHGSAAGKPAEDIAESIDEAELLVAPEHVPRSWRAFWREQTPALLAVSAGGIIGANLRYLAGLWIANVAGAVFPWGTMIINVSGSFILGLFLTLATERFSVRPVIRLFLATGVLGAYTTFSTFSFETVQLFLQGQHTAAIAYVAVSLAGGCAAAWIGMIAARLI